MAFVPFWAQRIIWIFVIFASYAASNPLYGRPPQDISKLDILTTFRPHKIGISRFSMFLGFYRFFLQILTFVISFFTGDQSSL